MVHVENTALLVIDVQTGAFDGVMCPVISDSNQLLTNIERLIDAARSNGTRVIFIQHCASANEVFAEKSEQWQFHKRVMPLAEEQVLKKQESSAFSGTDLHTVLKTRGIEMIVICGLQSEHCVSNTAISALELGFEVIIAEDAHSTWPNKGLTAEEISKRQNEILSQKGAITKPTSQLIDAFFPD